MRLGFCEFSGVSYYCGIIRLAPLPCCFDIFVSDTIILLISFWRWHAGVIKWEPGDVLYFGNKAKIPHHDSLDYVHQNEIRLRGAKDPTIRHTSKLTEPSNQDKIGRFGDVSLRKAGTCTRWEPGDLLWEQGEDPTSRLTGDRRNKKQSISAVALS
jgi:hypothetical protein